MAQNIEQKALYQIAKSFYQAYRVTGTVRMKFGLRPIADSDGNSVVDVYLSPRDLVAASTLNVESHASHLQFLESMVPSRLLGYQYILNIQPAELPANATTDELSFEIVEVVAPVTYTEC